MSNGSDNMPAVLASLQRIEVLLTAILGALLGDADEEQAPGRTLDGDEFDLVQRADGEPL